MGKTRTCVRIALELVNPRIVLMRVIISISVSKVIRISPIFSEIFKIL